MAAGVHQGSWFHRNSIISSPPVSQAFHKRAIFDSVFSSNACILTSNLSKWTHDWEKDGRKHFRQSKVMPWFWPYFKYESSFVSLFPWNLNQRFLTHILILFHWFKRSQNPLLVNWVGERRRPNAFTRDALVYVTKELPVCSWQWKVEWCINNKRVQERRRCSVKD